jgi:hemolysin activation/secretion protein
VQATTDFGIFGSMSSFNRPIEEGYDRGVVADIDWKHRDRLTVRFAQRVSGGSLGGDFRYNRSELFLKLRYFLVGPHELELSGRGITTGDTPPVQRLADIGGLMTVRGYDRRTIVGEHGVALRLEYLFPYDIFYHARVPLLKKAQLQFIPWGDAGRVGDGTTTEWIHSVGFGIQRYLGPFEEASNLRLDFAWPTSDLKQDNFRVFLSFTAQTF